MTSRCKPEHVFDFYRGNSTNTQFPKRWVTTGFLWCRLIKQRLLQKGCFPVPSVLTVTHQTAKQPNATQTNFCTTKRRQNTHTHTRTDRKNDARAQFGFLRPTCTHAQTCKRRCNLDNEVICATYRATRKIDMNAPARCVHAMKRLQRRYLDSSMIQGTAIFGVCKRLLRTHIQQSHNNHSCKLVSRSHADQRAIEVLGAKPAHTNQPETVNILICWQPRSVWVVFT